MEKWWFITWSTYGSWLPGDPRGFQSWRGREHVPPPKRYSRGATETYDASDYERRLAFSKSIVEESVQLSHDDRTEVLDAIVEDLATTNVQPFIMSVAAEHVHFLAIFHEHSIRQLIGRIKSVATRRIKRRRSDLKRVWSRNCHMTSVNGRRHFDHVFEYVRRHEDQGALVYVWD